MTSLPCSPSSITAGIVRASSVFPILSTCLLMLGGLCVGLGRVYNKTNNVLLSAGILFVAAGEREDYVVPASSQRRAIMWELGLIMSKGSLMWHLWSRIEPHEWCSHKDRLMKVRISTHHTHKWWGHRTCSHWLMNSFTQWEFVSNIQVTNSRGEKMKPNWKCQKLQFHDQSLEAGFKKQQPFVFQLPLIFRCVVCLERLVLLLWNVFLFSVFFI